MNFCRQYIETQKSKEFWTKSLNYKLILLSPKSAIDINPAKLNHMLLCSAEFTEVYISKTDGLGEIITPSDVYQILVSEFQNSNSNIRDPVIRFRMQPPWIWQQHKVGCT